jgi:hypothetical protein
MLLNGGDGMAADGAGRPLDDAQHAVELTVRATSDGENFQPAI